jgi:hypothetical protein
MDSKKVLFLLAVLTAVEVGWAVLLPIPVWAIRAGLVALALWKGYLIFMFFMHMKFEGWIVKGLMLPTVPLMFILVFANMPDTSFNDKLVYPIGSMASPDGGEVHEIKDVASGGHSGQDGTVHEEDEH